MGTRGLFSRLALTALGALTGTRSAGAQDAGACPSASLTNQACWLRSTTGATPEALFAEGTQTVVNAVDLDGDGVEEQAVQLSRPEMGHAVVLVLLRRGPAGWTGSIESSSEGDGDDASWSGVIAVGPRRLARLYRGDCRNRAHPAIHHTIFYAQRGGPVQRAVFESDCRLVFPQATVLPDGSIEFTHWTSPPRSRRVRSLVLQWNAATQQYTAGDWRPVGAAPARTP